jgi:cytochrome c oxidase cbb3-type subunit 1
MGETQTMNAASAGTFNYKVVRQFTVMTVVWGIVGMLVGVIIAAQLIWPISTSPGFRTAGCGPCTRTR